MASIDEVAVRDLFGRVESAENACDADALASLFTEDGMVLDPNVPLLKGRDAIRSFYAELYTHTRVKVATVAEEMQVTGPWAYIRMSVKISFTSKADGTSQERTGKGIWIATKQADDSWKLFRTSFNFDADY